MVELLEVFLSVALALACPTAVDAFSDLKSAVIACGDVNGDGIPDLACASRDLPASPCIWWISGKDGTVIRRIEPRYRTHPGEFRLSNVGDFDGDGIPDLAVSGSGVPLRVYSGRNASLLSELPGVSDLAPVRDVDGDGRVDMLELYPGRGAVLRFGAKDKPAVEIRATVDDPMWYGEVGDAVCWTSDVDGDGMPDVAIASVQIEMPTSPRTIVRAFGVAVHSSRDGRLLWEYLDKEHGSGASSILRPFVDIDGDGVPDVLAGLKDCCVVALSGKSGAVLLKHENARPRFLHSFASTLDVIGDLDGDGIPEWLVGSNEDVEPFFVSGGLSLVSGKTGKLMREIEYSFDFGFDVCALGDVDGDGSPDFAEFVAAKFSGSDSAVRVLSGRPSRLIWAKSLPELRCSAPSAQPK